MLLHVESYHISLCLTSSYFKFEEKFWFYTSLEKSCSTGSLILTSSSSLTAFNLCDGFFAFLNMLSRGVPSIRFCSRVEGMLRSWCEAGVERDREKNIS